MALVIIRNAHDGQRSFHIESTAKKMNASSVRWRSFRRWRRKHQLAILCASVFLAIFFFPSLFMGRVVSPNDILYHYEPWGTLGGGGSQNATLNDIPTSYLTLMTLLKGDWSAFHWNPYIASGIPGFGQVGAAVLTPFVAIPTLLLPLLLIYTGIILLKFTVSFGFAYMWLREERLGKTASAVGAIVVAGAGVVAVWWLWPATNAIALYPVLLYLTATSFRRPLPSVPLLVLVAVSFLLAGFPSTMSYGVYVVVLYALFCMVRLRRIPLGSFSRALLAAGLSLLIVLPFIHPFASLLMRTGYLQARDRASAELFYPRQHIGNFVDPYRLGDPVGRDWVGDASLGAMNNFLEATVYVGLLPLLLLVFAPFARRAGARWFWLILLVLVVLMMFDVGPFPDLLGRLPGIRYTPLTRLRFVLPICVGYLAAAGLAVILRVSRQLVSNVGFRQRAAMFSRAMATGAALLVSVDLALFAAHFYPYLKPARAKLPAGATERFLAREARPFRIAPYFSYFFPNTSEMLALEDIRSHFSSEHLYRKMLQRMDPHSWGEFGTIIQFNGLHFDLTDPFLSMLNVRYLIEQPSIDIVRWSIYSHTKPGGPDRGAMKILPGQRLQRQIEIPDNEVQAIDLIFGFEAATSKKSRLAVKLIRPETGKVLYQRLLSAEDLQLPKTYIPLRPYARAGNVLLLQLESHGIRAGLLRTDSQPGQSPFSYGLVRFPVILLHEFADGRVFQNVANLERFRAVWALQRSSVEAFLARKNLNIEKVAFSPHPDAGVSRTLAAVPPLERNVTFEIMRNEPAEQLIRTTSRVPFLLVSSEKVTPELRAYVDDRPVQVMTVNAMFAALPVREGEHVIRFSRRIGRGWWIPSLLALIALIPFGIVDGKRRRGSRSSAIPSRQSFRSRRIVAD